MPQAPHCSPPAIISSQQCIRGNSTKMGLLWLLLTSLWLNLASHKYLQFCIPFHDRWSLLWLHAILRSPMPLLKIDSFPSTVLLASACNTLHTLLSSTRTSLLFPPPGRLFHVVIHVGRSPASFGSFLKPPLICTSQYTTCVLFIYCAHILSPYHHPMKEGKFALFFATVFTCL